MKTHFPLHFFALLLVALVGPVQAEPKTALYQITLGEDVTIGGFAGSWTNRLPNSAEHFVEVTTDVLAGTASARILGTNGNSVSIALLNGTLLGNQIRFRYITNHPYFPFITDLTTLDYTVNFTDSALSLNGSLRSQPRCCDIPHTFLHSGVQAVRRPDLFTLLLPSINFGVSTNQVFPGDPLGVRWRGYNNATVCLADFGGPCPERFGPASGPWQDGIFLFNDSTNRLLGVGTFTGVLPIGGGYDGQGTFVVPLDLAPGRYGVEIRIDYAAANTNGVVAEQNETNNADRRANVLTVLPRLAFTGVHRIDDHTVQLQVSGSVPQPVRIQASPSVSGGTWTDLTNSPAFRGMREFHDDTATNEIRFYQVVSP